MLGKNLITAATGGAGETGWSLANATFNGSPINFVSIYEQEPNAGGLAFKADGTKMYLCGNNNDAVYEYNFSTAWDVSTAVVSQSFSVASQEGSPQGLFFSGDGTKMYVIGIASDTVHEYTLSTAWDVSTASYTQGFSISAQEASPYGVAFKTDGTKMYVVGSSSDNVNEYTLSTAWDVSSAAFSRSYSIAGQVSNSRDIAFKDDGTQMYVSDNGNIYLYNLSTAWDVSTSSFSSSASLAPGGGSGVAFKTDGSALFGLNADSDAVHKLSMSAVWDISTLSFTFPSSETFSVASEELAPAGIAFSGNGDKMYIIGSAGDDVNEYNLSTNWDISTASYSQSFSISAQETTPSSLAFSSDGTKFYITGGSSDSVNEYNMSTAWDVSTASYFQSFSIIAKEANVQGLAFSANGDKMYIVGIVSDSVHKYDLSTSWDVSTASFSSSYSTVTQDGTMTGLMFKTDGRKMFLCGSNNDSVYEYALSTAWDVSTASFTSSFRVGAYDTSIADLAFNDEGTKLYIIGSNLDRIWSFDL